MERGKCMVVMCVGYGAKISYRNTCNCYEQENVMLDCCRTA